MFMIRKNLCSTLTNSIAEGKGPILPMLWKDILVLLLESWCWGLTLGDLRHPDDKVIHQEHPAFTWDQLGYPILLLM